VIQILTVTVAPQHTTAVRLHTIFNLLMNYFTSECRQRGLLRDNLALVTEWRCMDSDIHQSSEV
jgi:hypothetical protein